MTGSSREITVVFLGLIILIGFFLRIFFINYLPPSISGDEAAVGFNAYSVLTTGKDEYGEILPLIFQSFGDSKLPVPVYLTIPTVAIFGLNEFSVRLPAAVFGSFTILIFYLLTKKITKNQLTGLIAAIFLTISPWHLHLSRINFEPVWALFFLSLALYFYLTYFEEKKIKFWLAASLGLVLTLLTGYNAWAFGIPAVFLLFFLNRKALPKNKIYFLGLLILIGSLFLVLIDGLKYNFWLPSFLSDFKFVDEINYYRGLGSNSLLGVISPLVFNKITFILERIAKNYLSAFDFYYLFSGGDYKEQFGVVGFGKFFYFQLLLFFVGVYKLLQTTNWKGWLPIIWIFLSPIPGILANNQNLGFSFFFIILPFYIIAAIGTTLLFELRSNLLKILTVSPLALLLILGSTNFLHYYFEHYPKQNFSNWYFGYKEMFNQLGEIDKDYKKVVITDRLGSHPYIFYLFYSKFDPEKFQAGEKSRGGFNFISVSKFKNIEFRSIDLSKEIPEKNSLYIGLDSELPNNLPTIAKTYLPNRKVAFKFVQF